MDKIGRARAEAADERARLTEKRVDAGLTGQCIVAQSAIENVVAIAAAQCVFDGSAIEDIVGGVSNERIASLAAGGVLEVDRQRQAASPVGSLV